MAEKDAFAKAFFLLFHIYHVFFVLQILEAVIMMDINWKKGVIVGNGEPYGLDFLLIMVILS